MPVAVELVGWKLNQLVRSNVDVNRPTSALYKLAKCIKHINNKIFIYLLVEAVVTLNIP